MLDANNYISLNDLCQSLSISAATGRNWLKLGKITPQKTIKRTVYFTQDYLLQLRQELQAGTNTALKSRRNKKFVSGTNIYNSYVSESSAAQKYVQTILDYIADNKLTLDTLAINTLIAETAVQIILRDTLFSQTGNCLAAYLTNAVSLNGYECFIDDLIEDKSASLKFIYSHPKLFCQTYQYEEREDILGLLYISTKNLGTRKATGSYYTPTKVVKQLCSKLLAKNNFKGKKFLDPCCGTGNFLLQLPKKIKLQDIYAADTDLTSIKITRLNLALKYAITDKQILCKHIVHTNYLTHKFSYSFDFIIGNPPWGYDFSEAEKSFLRSKYASAAGTNIESYDIFIEQSLENLKANGVLAFVLPEAILNVKTHMPIREILLKKCSFQYLNFLGNAFDKVQCPCIILQIQNTHTNDNCLGLEVQNDKRSFTIKTNRPLSATYFSFATTDEEYTVLQKLKARKNNCFLADNAIFALGIVTGNNKKYITNQKNITNEIILKGSDIYKYRFHEAENYIVFEPNLFQQVAPTQYYRAAEKLLYRFICNQLVFAYDAKQTLSLNSCNLLIPQIKGLSVKYILAILNSRAAQFFFKKTFNSVKVLRSHIEQIPIPRIEKEQQEKIIAYVDTLIAAPPEADILPHYDELDQHIAELYNLTPNEYQIIKESIQKENLFLN